MSGFLFVEHLAVYPEYRMRGHATRAIKDVQVSGSPIVLEVELPTNRDTKRRVKCYERARFLFNDYYYLQPP